VLGVEVAPGLHGGIDPVPFDPGHLVEGEHPVDQFGRVIGGEHGGGFGDSATLVGPHGQRLDQLGGVVELSGERLDLGDELVGLGLGRLEPLSHGVVLLDGLFEFLRLDLDLGFDLAERWIGVGCRRR
jgi:hypothetical protein